MVDFHAWPYKEAEKVADKIERDASRKKAEDKPVLFETGYGPSGLPHIGTFAEVARTTWVQRAWSNIDGKSSKLIAFSDDMDGLRSIPDNVPNKKELRAHLGKPLCEIPDPFGEEDSFSGYMNAQLRRFLDQFAFDYEFRSSKDQYRSGVFDEGLKKILENHDAIRDVILPTLGHKKGDGTDRSEWSPFMPICPECGKVYTTRVTDLHPEDGEISFACDSPFHDKDGNEIEACGYAGRGTVTGGNVKVGWKVDWALRWYVFGVDYEMYGKDLIESAELSSAIVRILGGVPPAGFFYEMFLDENGQKISKSKGNGLEIDEWLEYGPLESLAWFIFQNPTKARKLHFDMIPKSVDDYLEARAEFASLDESERVNSPIWFVDARALDAGEEIAYEAGVSYSMLLNLVSVLNTDDEELVWDYVRRYEPNADKSPEMMERLIKRALNYYRDFVAPTKQYELPADEMMPALEQLMAFLENYDGDDAEEIQSATYAAGKETGVKLGKWFSTMYKMLLGQQRGPRLGTFIKLYGVQETLELIRKRLDER